MSTSEICQLISSLGLLATAAVLCWHSFTLYRIGRDLSDNCDKVLEAADQVMELSGEDDFDRDAAPDLGISPKADLEQ